MKECRQLLSFIGTGQGSNNYPKTIERSAHTERWLHFDGEVQRAAFGTLFAP
jgi:hypothetical protein